MQKITERHSAPITIISEVQKALSYYPDLQDVSITFKFKDKLSTSVMKAQPTWATLFNGKKKRAYIILISRNLQIDGQKFDIHEIPKEVLIGWLGHELGHVMDYRCRSTINLIIFGLAYLISGKHIKNAEREADVFAVKAGMQDYILATKNFILNHSSLSDKYKARIKKFYLSPEEIMHLVKQQS
ncbi:hypothetical protein ACFQ1M_00205 [Sungkyunkwania multivorans]|uniref:Peptidase M48 domain-containing protein n=1 Tax=Sungkyunkwania multivorans TaxID=1173618 RepID=A0ABW3CUW2_9FLAO